MLLFIIMRGRGTLIWFLPGRLNICSADPA